MKKRLFSLLFLITTTAAAGATPPTKDEFWPPEKLQASKVCLLALVRSHLKIAKPSPLVPELKLESTTSLKEYQDAMEIWWHYRPEVFTSVHDAGANKIYLLNNLKWYALPRTPVDSLAHELTHFVQIRDLNQSGNDEDQLEIDAVKVQDWFRTNYGKYIVHQEYHGPCK